jgi:hypothetical protein
MTYIGEIKGLKEVGGELICNRSIQNHTACILVKKGVRILLLMRYCCRDLAAVKIKTLCGRGPRQINVGSAYLPYDDAEPHTPVRWRGS